MHPFHAVHARSLVICLTTLVAFADGNEKVRDIPAPHHLHEPHPLPQEPAQDVRRLAVDGNNRVWAATRAGLFQLDPDRLQWSMSQGGPSGPCYDLALGMDGTLWVASWDGLYKVRHGASEVLQTIRTPVRALGLLGDSIVTGGPAGYHRVRGDHAEHWMPGCTRYIHRIQPGENQRLFFATSMGLYSFQNGEGSYWTPDFNLRSVDVRDVAPGRDGEVWVATLGGLLLFQNQQLTSSVRPADGLPSADVRSVAIAPDGSLWVGTAQGVARLDQGEWSIRQGRRWLLDDDVRHIAFDSAGAAWIATGNGVSCLRQTNLTLSAKADHFLSILRERHVRPPGIVEKCRLPIPGDLSQWEPEDDDNDGGYTALYLAMESFRYAATGDPDAREAANRTFAALEFLLSVTGNDGFPARTVIPATWKTMHDPNQTETDQEWAEAWISDPRNKRVPLRWRLSSDGQWLWKGDTSSDEIAAHFFGYYVYHELAADKDHRLRVRSQVARIMDHIIRNGLLLVDIDGRHTRWGVWAPDRLNSDPDWAMERGINSVEILSFLRLAQHVTGDSRYEAEYRALIDEHRYATNCLEAPNLNPAWRTYIDTELLAFSYPALLTLETNPQLLLAYRRSFDQWHDSIRHDGNPFFEFLYAKHGSPARASLDAAREFLSDVPLDLIRWTADNSRREDVRLQRFPAVEAWQTDRLLPPSEICYSRTDQNPWLAVQGDGGRTESDAVFFLLPYWMGRHLGLITPP